jgi:hypothetical protein
MRLGLRQRALALALAVAPLLVGSGILALTALANPDRLLNPQAALATAASPTVSVPYPILPTATSTLPAAPTASASATAVVKSPTVTASPMATATAIACCWPSPLA